MRRCLKTLKLLVEKKVAEVEGNNLEAWEYQGMIKHHIEKCPSCRKFVERIHKRVRTKRGDAYSFQSAPDVLTRVTSCGEEGQEEG